MSSPFDFCERGKRHFFRIFGSLLYASLHPFFVTYLHALMQVDHHSLFYLFVCFYLYFIPPFHSTSSDFFLFSSYLMFDLGSTSTLYSCLFDIFIPLSSLFVWGSLGMWLMIFSTYCISCMRGMRIISLRLLGLVSFRFFHPKTLAYATSRVLRPPWGHDFTLCLIAHVWAILEIGWRLFLGAWWMGSWGDGLHWGIPLLSVMDFQRWCDIH